MTYYKFIKKLILQFAFRCLPTSFLLFFVKSYKRPYLLPLAKGRTFRFSKYLNQYTILADPLYPIEQEMLSGEYDPDSIAVINRFVTPGAFCLDVGANVGALSLAMAQRAGSTGQVFAFEPGPLIERLKGNLDLNPRLKTVIHPIKLGLAETPGQFYWAEDPNNRGNAGLTEMSTDEPVEVTTLDQFFSNHSTKFTHLEFVKIDVEGMEASVIKGGLKTWQQFQPTLYFETDSRFTEFRNQFYEISVILTGIGYSMFTMEQDTLVPVVDVPIKNNTIALPKTRLANCADHSLT